MRHYRALFDELVEPSDTVIVERPTYDRTLLGLRQRLADIRAVELEPEPVADAFPEATPRLVVFLHGLMETELDPPDPGEEAGDRELSQRLLTH